MKKLLILILLICFAYNAWALSGPVMQIATDGGCNTVQAPSETDASYDSQDVGKYNDRTRIASQFIYDGTNGKAICKVRLPVKFTGSSTHNYNVAIYSDSGSDVPNVAIGTSDNYDLKDVGASEVSFDFEFSTPTSALANGTKYWVVMQSVADADDGSNYASWYQEATGTTELVYDYDTTGPGWQSIGTTYTKMFILYSI